jgi:hypothetical protein
MAGMLPGCDVQIGEDFAKSSRDARMLGRLLPQGQFAGSAQFAQRALTLLGSERTLRGIGSSRGFDR